MNDLVEVCILSYDGREHTRLATFKPGDSVGRVSCLECEGTGWWGYGPTSAECGPCINCKGTGRWYVGLS